MNKLGEKLNKAAMIIARIAEVFHWVATALFAVGLVVYFINDAWLKYIMNIGNGEFAVSGYAIRLLDSEGKIVPAAFIAAMIAGVIVCGLMAMVFRNICLIFKATAGQTKFCEGATPFQSCNVRMIREIGIFVLSMPVIEFIIDTVMKLGAGVDAVESAVSWSGVVFGIAVLCLSQFFAYGVQLQSDADGLL